MTALRFFDFLPERMEVKLADEVSSVTPQGGVSEFEWIEVTRAKGGSRQYTNSWGQRTTDRRSS